MKYFFTTLIPNEHKFVNNAYVHGRVCVVLKLICSPDRPIHMGKLIRYSNPTEVFGFFFEVVSTDEKYAEAQKIIEQWYPGMCMFNYPHDVDQSAIDCGEG